MTVNHKIYWNKPLLSKIYSDVLQEERHFSVYLPASYATGSETYPVLFHLDGDALQLDSIFSKSENNPESRNIPDLIYLSLENTDRVRDMSPVQTSFCDNPGADQFMHFIASELIPHIEEKYRASSFRILCGQSYSSVFTLYALLENPGLFSGYITNSLYFPQSKDFFMEKAASAFGKNNFRTKYLFMAVGGKDRKYNLIPETEKSILEFIEIIKKKNPPGFRWDFRVYEQDDHCPEPAYAGGLQWIFSDMDE
jgi:predicted alpha/beta superfamily hydrolase